MKKFKNVIIICFLAVLIIGYYYYLSNKNQPDAANKTVETSKIDETLASDISTEMKTPRSTVKFYTEVVECFYNESPTDDQIEQLGNKARELFDDELLENNSEDDYFGDLKTEIDEYAESRRIVMSSEIGSSEDVEYYTENDKEYATIYASYTLRETEVFTKSNEEYILRKDDEGNWKILGWRLTANEVSDDEEDE